MDQRLSTSVSVVPELTVAVQLAQILEDGRATRSAIDHLNIKMFGDLSVEGVGRFTLLESAVKDLRDRVDKLEKSVLRYVSWATGAGFVAGLILHYLVH
jgi:hypothetical protein